MALDAIGIVSKDLEKTLKFYKLFGISLQKEGDGDHYEALTSTGLRLMVDSLELIQKINPAWVQPATSSLVLCFKQDGAESVDSLYTQIIESGFQSVKEPWDAFWGQRYASVQDPDGNQIDIFADL